MRPPTRRRLLRTAASGALVGLAGCGALREDVVSRLPGDGGEGGDDEGSDESGERGTPTDAPEPTVAPSEMVDPPAALREAPVAAEARPYATFGSADADLTVELFGSWKCAKTADYVLGEFQTLLAEYVAPGDVAVEFRHVAYTDGHGYLGADAPDAGRAGLAVWTAAPDAYPRYFGTVFANRPPTHVEWATPAQLAAFARRAAVPDPGRVGEAVREGRHDPALRRTADRVVALDLDGIPRVVVDGTVTAPLQDAEATYDAIDERLE